MNDATTVHDISDLHALDEGGDLLPQAVHLIAPPLQLRALLFHLPAQACSVPERPTRRVPRIIAS